MRTPYRPLDEGRTGIPTRYGLRNFRSRLEARWAAFFDRCQWPWEYEPIDLQGYIPDFVLLFRPPILVEVKPECTLDALRSYTAKIDQSGWANEALIVGATLFPSQMWTEEYPVLGLLNERGEMFFGEWDEGLLVHCGHCLGPSITHAIQSYRCRRCGVNDGGLPPWMEWKSAWASAGNLTQWRAP